MHEGAIERFVYSHDKLVASNEESDVTSEQRQLDDSAKNFFASLTAFGLSKVVAEDEIANAEAFLVLYSLTPMEDKRGYRISTSQSNLEHMNTEWQKDRTRPFIVLYEKGLAKPDILNGQKLIKYSWLSGSVKRKIRRLLGWEISRSQGRFLPRTNRNTQWEKLINTIVIAIGMPLLITIIGSFVVPKLQEQAELRQFRYQELHAILKDWNNYETSDIEWDFFSQTQDAIDMAQVENAFAGIKKHAKEWDYIRALLSKNARDNILKIDEKYAEADEYRRAYVNNISADNREALANFYLKSSEADIMIQALIYSLISEELGLNKAVEQVDEPTPSYVAVSTEEQEKYIVIGLASDNDEQRFAAFLSLYCQGLLYFSNGDMDSAFQLFRRIEPRLEDESKLVMIYPYIALMHLAKGENDSYYDYIERTKSLNPEDNTQSKTIIDLCEKYIGETISDNSQLVVALLNTYKEVMNELSGTILFGVYETVLRSVYDNSSSTEPFEKWLAQQI